MYDERMLHFLARLAEMHVDPAVSDPRKIVELPDDERVEGEDRPDWHQEEVKNEFRWSGLYKDVGIFSEHEWHLFMCKCLASMGVYGYSNFYNSALTGGLQFNRDPACRCWLTHDRAER